MTRTLRLHLAGIALAAAALAVVPAGAGAATSFGANLNRPANAAFDCSTVPAFGFSTGVDTCTWWSTGTVSGNVSESLVVPSGGGVVTRVRVKVGPITGPMQVLAIRSIRNPNSLAFPGCCFYVGESHVFTPAANGVTAVDVNIPVRNEIDRATGLANYDTLALSVLEPGVPLPVHETGDFSMGPSSGALYPHMQTGQERADVAGLTGYQLLINADLEPAPAPGPALAPPVAPPTIPEVVVVGNPVALRVPTGRLHRAAVEVSLVCRLTTVCDGVLRLHDRRTPAARAAKTGGARTYASVRFSIAAGKSDTVRARLSKLGKRVLGRRRNRGRKLWATATLGSGASKQVVNLPLKLR